MTAPSPTLVSAIELLGNILIQTSESYQRLLNNPKSIPLCREAGLTMRYLSDRYSKVLLAGFSQQPNSGNDLEHWDDQSDTYFEEEPDS